jgi:hypothetical protein
MEPVQVTCSRVEQEDLDARYLAGTLSEEEAEAFEEHYFACDRCWATVQLGLDVRAANDTTVRTQQPRPAALSVERAAPAPASRLRRQRWWPIAIAASVAILAVGVWQQRSDRSDVPPIVDDLRGPADSIRAVASVRGRTLVISWPPKPNADRYGVRLQKSDATVVVDRIISDTSLVISRDSLAGVVNGERLYWEVRALDALRRTIARSRLIPVPVPTVRR